jgi:hypothetical protein
MDSSKAKKAKSKAQSRKSAVAADEQQSPLQSVLMQQQQHRALMQEAGHLMPLTPEVQAKQIAMQTPTVNPYHIMGTVVPNMYNPGNVVHGGYVPGS